MKLKILAIAVMPIFPMYATQAAEPMPALCNSAINYAAQTLNLGLSDGSFADANNPTSLTLKLDFKKFPISNVKLVDDCESANSNPTWCQVAGGAPVVYSADVSEVFPAAYGQPAQSMPVATVTVTYNRGGCWVDQVEAKN